MPTTQQIEWADGSGDKIYISASEFSGNQQIAVSSDPNTGAARSKVITFAAGNASQTLTVNQAAGTPTPSYVTDGLVLWLDGIEKGGTNSWIDKINGTSFGNHGATFNTDHVYFDGTDDYLDGTFTAPKNSAGTIEVCFEREGTGTRIAFMAQTTNSLAFGCIDTVLNWSNGTNRTTWQTLPTKGTVGVNVNRAIANGVAMTTRGNTYLSGRGTVTLIGKRSSGNFFMGKIYSIRIYNRALTENEILANQRVDNARFNLGLTI